MPILAFSGHPFLAQRRARERVAELHGAGAQVTYLEPPLEVRDLLARCQQGGLFEQPIFFLDFSQFFVGQAGVKPRNALLKGLAGADFAATLVLLDPEATAARQKTLKTFGEFEHVPLPRYEHHVRFVRNELTAAGLAFEPDVPQLLSELFEAEPAEMFAEFEKFRLLGGTLTREQVADIVQRPVRRDAFELIDEIAAGNAAGAVRVARSLLEQGEAALRIMGAIAWQLQIVVRTVAFIAQHPRGASQNALATALGIRPFVAGKALRIARNLDEERVRVLTEQFLHIDTRLKTGGDEHVQLEVGVARLALTWQGRKSV